MPLLNAMQTIAIYYSPEYRIETGGSLLSDSEQTDKYVLPEVSLLGMDILKIHPDNEVAPLNMLHEMKFAMLLQRAFDQDSISSSRVPRSRTTVIRMRE